MTSSLFVLAVAALFALVFSVETSADPRQPRLGQYGLFTWISTGNWTAKVGAGLLILGIGALLRYALLHIDVPPAAKLNGGMLLAALLGAASWSLKNKSDRRAIHLALAGAAFGVAYLTAYAAYDLFGYLSGVNAFALLALVAAATGVFAVSSNSMSVAVLAMAGAYIAPAFGLKDQGPLPIYGYYVAVSAMSLAMISMRGWRALIHLSFLFTLAGAIFFAWTSHYYQPQYHAVMQPMLLALAALHLAMPLVERRHIPSTWLSRFDLGYFILLPVVGAALMLLIAPSYRVEGAIGLVMLALVWFSAALILKALDRSKESLQHGVIAILLAVGAALCRVDDIPWELLGLGLFLGVMVLTPRLGWPREAAQLASGVALLFFTFHVIFSLVGKVDGPVFLNQMFAERLLAIAMLGCGAWIAKRRNLDLAGVFAIMSGGWLVLTLLIELARLHLDFVPQLVYGVLLAVLFGLAVPGRDKPRPPFVFGLLMAALFCCGWWAADKASGTFAAAAAVMTPLTLLAVAWGGSSPVYNRGNDFSAVLALNVLPLALMPWVLRCADLSGMDAAFFMLSLVVLGAFCSSFAAHAWLASSVRWRRTQSLQFYVIAIVLIGVTLFHIERDVWAVAFELLALSFLVSLTVVRLSTGQTHSATAGTFAVVAATLVVQAMLLRALGPDGVMSFADLGRMRLPAVVSLIWVVMGAGLTWWGVKSISRGVWSAGAALLIVAAVKLVLFDFGSLGQLGNILALIAAGLVFLGVAWLAPLPPKAPVDATPGAGPETPPAPAAGPTSPPVSMKGVTPAMMMSGPLYKWETGQDFDIARAA